MNSEELIKAQPDYEPKRVHYNEDSMRIELNWWQSSLFFVGCLPCIVCMTVCGALCCLGTAVCCVGTTLLGAATYCGTCCCCSNCCGGCKTKLSERKGILKNCNEGQTCSKASSFSRTTNSYQDEIIHCTINVPDMHSPSTSATNSDERKPLKGILKNKRGPPGSVSTVQSTSKAGNSQKNASDSTMNAKDETLSSKTIVKSEERKQPEEILQNNGEEKSTPDLSTPHKLTSNIENIQKNSLDITPTEIKPPKEKQLENDERQTSMADSSAFPEFSSNMANSQEKMLYDHLSEKNHDNRIPRNNGGQTGRSSGLQPTSNIGNSQEKLLDSNPLISSDDGGSSFRDSPTTSTANEEAKDETLLSRNRINKEDEQGHKNSSSEPGLFNKKNS